MEVAYNVLPSSVMVGVEKMWPTLIVASSLPRVSVSNACKRPLKAPKNAMQTYEDGTVASFWQLSHRTGHD